MSQILLNKSRELDPELRELFRPLIDRWQVAVFRVAAAHEGPEFMPHAPKSGTPEAILAKRFNAMTEGKKRTAAAKAIKSLRRPAVQKRLRFRSSDLTQPRSVEETVSLSEAPITAERLASLVANLFGPERWTPGTSAHATRTLTLEMSRMAAVDETGWDWAGSDEIKLGGSAIDATADDPKAKKIGPLDLGNFDSGDQKNYSPPKDLCTFKLKGSAEYPRVFIATLALAEIDQGGFDQTVKDMVDKLNAQVEKKLKDILEAALEDIGGVVAHAFGGLVGIVVSYVMGKIVDAILGVWGDDTFNPVTLDMVIPSFDASFDGHGDLTETSHVVHFTGPGNYGMRYRWVLTKVPVSPEPVIA